jgi:PPP family 3-phenylpropionic acid transporter
VPVLVLAMMAGMLGFSFLVPEARETSHEAAAPIGRVLLNPQVFALIGGGAFMSAAHGPYYTFYSLHLVEHGYSKGATGWLWALGVICEIAIFVWMPRLYRAFTLRQVLIASFSLAVARFLMIGWLAQSMAALIVAQTLHAATFGAFHAASIGYVHRLFPGRLQARGQAMYGSISFGLGGALGGFASGAIWERAGAGLTFTFAAACAGLGGLIFARCSAGRHAP